MTERRHPNVINVDEAETYEIAKGKHQATGRILGHGDARVPIRAGDWIAHPVGPAHAHQMINDGDVPLVYLCMSTTNDCEVVGYPDSKKLMARGGPYEKPWLRQFMKLGSTLDRWDDEPDA